jgi:hypothetical protein
MKAKNDNNQLSDMQADGQTINDLPGYPLYPEGDDIFSRCREEQDLNPEDISKIKAFNSGTRSGSHANLNEKGGLHGSDLDVPGSELDDEKEEIGSEDEENNYYSIGGDDHNDLDENKG